MPKPPAAPKASASKPAVTVSARGATRLKSGHPWVYRSDLTASPEVAPGATVQVLDPRGKPLGTALYSSSSQIAIRMIASAREEVPDLPKLISERIRAALAYRKKYVENTDAYRVVFSEADFLPGLIIDRYNDVVSLQILTQALDAEPARGAIIETLLEELKPEGIVERVDPRIRDLEQLSPRDSGLLWGKKTSTIITMNDTTRKVQLENETVPPVRARSVRANLGSEKPGETSGVRFHYDALEGQKTGAFLDQRENYAAAARYAQGDALDVFCYQGGFALHLAGKCKSVTGVDSSRPALEMADQNAALNSREVDWIEANAFDLLRDYAQGGRKFDAIVLDPPAFAKTKRDLDKALSGYKELNLRALKMLQPGGILATCSCSFHVSQSDFQQTVAAAAQDAHKILRLLENRGASKDHPSVLNIPETSYLKCLVFNVSK
ncbi:MAG: class I SAM-dependent rRNA methyltransferase [Terriglobales bacterium]|jgi:23S rRNA (cytosine1962-C5)-methyltransferase